jgi:hypothetical protein
MHRRVDRERGSALLLVPGVLAFVVMLLVALADLAGGVLEQARLAQTAASCVLQAAQALSPSAYYQSGALVLDPERARLTAEQCVSASTPSFGSLSLSSFTTSGSQASITLTTTFTPPLTMPFLRQAVTMSLQASSAAQEQ